MGVTGPRIETFSKPNNTRVDNKYNEPEKQQIPAINEPPAIVKVLDGKK